MWNISRETQQNSSFVYYRIRNRKWKWSDKIIHGIFFGNSMIMMNLLFECYFDNEWKKENSSTNEKNKNKT